MQWYWFLWVLGVFVTLWVYSVRIFRREKHSGWSLNSVVFFLPIMVVFFAGISLMLYSIQVKRLQTLSGTDIVFLLDVSHSMDAQDYHINKSDLSRLDVAKQLIQKFVETHPNNRYGLTIFASDSNDILPITVDKGLFNRMLESVASTSFLQKWGNFLPALKIVKNRFSWDSIGGGVIIVSDFEFQNDPITDPNYLRLLTQTINEFQSRRIEILGFWVWNPNWSKIIEGIGPLGENLYKQDAYQHDVITRFDTEFFEAFLRKWWWKWMLISDISLINKAMSIIDWVSFSSRNYLQVQDQSISRILMILTYGIFLAFLFLFPLWWWVWRKKS